LEQYKKSVRSYIQAHQLQGVRLLKRLVQEKSVSGNESSAQAIVIEKLRELGLQLDIWEPSFRELERHPYFVSPRSSFLDSPNVVAVLKGSGGGRSIILNGHIDVVPEGDEQQWKYHPYKGDVEGNRLYGRGATDMKGGSTSLIMALEAIIACGIRLKGDICFQSVIEEESGGAGSLAAIIRGYKADGVLIPEPTNMKIFPKQQGSLWFRLTVKGQSAHGGTRYEGVSAIEKSIIVIEHVRRLENIRNERIQEPLYQSIPIPVPINIGRMTGGNWPSSVPDLLVLEGRYGVAPDEKLAEATQEFENWFRKLCEADAWFLEHPVEIEWFGARWVPGSLAEEHPLAQTLKQNFTLVRGEEPIIEASPWGTDGGLFTNVANIPTIVFGPGETKAAHQHDEYIEIDKMVEVAEMIACMLLDWCGVEE
jgi:acetylornithine deacetylase